MISEDQLNEADDFWTKNNELATFVKEIKFYRQKLRLVLSQIVNFDDLFELKIIARAHAMELNIKLEEK